VLCRCCWCGSCADLAAARKASPTYHLLAWAQMAFDRFSDVLGARAVRDRLRAVESALGRVYRTVGSRFEELSQTAIDAVIAPDVLTAIGPDVLKHRPANRWTVAPVDVAVAAAADAKATGGGADSKKSTSAAAAPSPRPVFKCHADDFDSARVAATDLSGSTRVPAEWTAASGAVPGPSAAYPLSSCIVTLHNVHLPGQHGATGEFDHVIAQLIPDPTDEPDAQAAADGKDGGAAAAADAAPADGAGGSADAGGGAAKPDVVSNSQTSAKKIAKKAKKLEKISATASKKMAAVATATVGGPPAAAAEEGGDSKSSSAAGAGASAGAGAGVSRTRARRMARYLARVLAIIESKSSADNILHSLAKQRRAFEWLCGHSRNAKGELWTGVRATAKLTADSFVPTAPISAEYAMPAGALPTTGMGTGPAAFVEVSIAFAPSSFALLDPAARRIPRGL
jgi:hypothetical protein